MNTFDSNHDRGRVRIFDTTLRDGEQSPGCTMSAQEKLRVAQALAELGVDVIEAGFPIASVGDFESVRQIARMVEGPIICGLARCNRADIERAAEAVRDSPRPRIHVFLATSAIHREFKLRMAKEQIVRRAVEGVSRAKEFCADVEFSPEDASRTELEFLAEVVERAIEAGATTINIPDTVGYAMPDQYGACFEYLKKQVRGIERIVLSAHCHDDLGLAVANSLAAVCAGARQVECTINGIGERAGNAALEEIVMAVATRADFFGGVTTGINTRRLHPVSRLVCSVTGSAVQSNKAIVGENAFAHEAGIHQHGMLHHHATYEIMRPEEVGISRSSLVLGKHSGRHAFRERVEQLGFTLDDVELNRCFEEFKRLADRKKDMFDRDIEAIIMNADGGKAGPWAIAELHVTAGTGAVAAAAVKLLHVDGQELREAAPGDGPVAAAFTALERATGIELKLTNFEVQGVTDGDDAQGEVTITVEYNQQSFRGHAVSTDIVEAAALAYLEVINRIIRRRAAGASPVERSVALGSP